MCDDVSLIMMRSTVELCICAVLCYKASNLIVSHDLLTLFFSGNTSCETVRKQCVSNYVPTFTLKYKIAKVKTIAYKLRKCLF